MLRKMDVDRVIGGVALLMIHEVDVLSRQWGLLGASWADLRGWHGELQRQLRERRCEDRQIRRELWQGLQRDIRSGP